MNSAMRICVTPLDGAFDLGLASILDTLATANEVAVLQGADLRFHVRLIGVRRRVRTAQGLHVPVEPVPRRRPDIVIVPALGEKQPETIGPRLERPETADVRALLQEWHRRGATVSAACTGTFVLAGTGLLDGGPATTSWWLGPYFRERFPDVDLDETRMVVSHGRCATAGAALSHIDLALSIVRRESPSLASAVARYLVVDPRPSGTSYVIPDHIQHDDEVVSAFDAWVRQRLEEPFRVGRAAKAIGASERTLGRRLQRTLGKSPLAYVQDLRIQRAVHLLRTSNDSVDEIAGAVGYQDGVTLRTLLRKRTGRGIRELRRDWER
ncbi:MAG: helix-turn-helix domain-containing protein [Myxococcota bacterium]